jgi:hypothetical protein
MKKKKESETKVEEKPIDVILDIPHQIKISDMLVDIAMSEADPKRVLATYGSYCLFEGLPHVTTMLSLFSTNEDVRRANAGIILKYVVERWDDVLKEAIKHYKECNKREERQNES